MSRVKRGSVHLRKLKRLRKDVKGYRGGRSRLLRTAKETLLRARAFAYRDRKQRKRTFRSLWITRISAATRNQGLSYSQFIHGLTRAQVTLDRRTLADLAVRDADAFAELVELARSQVR